MNESIVLQPKPYRKLPTFLGRIRNEAVYSSLTESLNTSFSAANIRVRAEGVTSNWQQEGQGALFIGGTHKPSDRFVLMSILGKFGRKDVRFIAKSFAKSVRLTASLDPEHETYTLPVIPSYLGKNRPLRISRDIFFRLKNRKKLLDEQEIRQSNNRSLKEASRLLQEGYVVNIFPQGKTGKNTRGVWLPGVGKILSVIPQEKRNNIAVVPYQLVDSSALSMLARLFLNSLGIRNRGKDIRLILPKQQYSVKDIIGTETDPKKITELLRQQYSSNILN